MKFSGKLLLFFLSCYVSIVNAQVFDDFSDGDFTNNPMWTGTTTKFIINSNFELQSNGNSASGDTLFLSTPNTLFDSVEYNFKVKLGFNPSSTNYLRIYLASDNSNFRTALNGYYLQLGEVGSSDTIKIFKQTGTSTSLVFTGTSTIISSGASSANINFHITRKSNGEWDILADKTGGNNYTSYGSFTDNTHTTTSYFGFYCRYSTASRFDKYVFDDINIHTIVGDTVQPFVQNIAVISATQLDVLFSENVDESEAQNTANYNLNNGVGNPQSATVNGTNKSLIHLFFSPALANGTNYTLTVSNIGDVAGNKMNVQQLNFSFYQAQQYDVLINEIMPDPEPKVGLPSVEFVELYNKIPFNIDVGGWKFSDASSEIILPAIIIPANSFAVLVRSDSAPLFSALGAFTIPVSTLPSLNNDKDSLTLKDAFGNVIHSLVYSDKWYGDEVKKQGGYSLELRNPENPCVVEGNWIASNNASGGTPGKTNSTYDKNLALDFRAESAVFINLNSIQISLNQIVDEASVLATANYTVNNGVGSPQSVIFTSVSKSATLVFSQDFDTTKIYELAINGIKNCVANDIIPTTFTLAFPQKAARYDVVISEIMANPDPPVALPNREYLEIYNRSNKAISLKDWQLGKPSTSVVAKLPDILLMPDKYLLLCNTSAVSDFTDFTYPVGLANFPSLNNSGDAVYLKDKDGNLIHFVEYSDDWYKSNTKKNGGWSLEMIDTDNPCMTSVNWSASQSSLGGTPGTQNSHNTIITDISTLNISNAYLIDTHTLLITFDQSLDSATAANPNFYAIDNNVGNPQNVEVSTYSFKRVLLTYAQGFQRGITYTVHVSDNVIGCNGNAIGIVNSAQFSLPDSIEKSDVVINEILFNPRSGGVDYLELYNRSSKTLDASKLIVQEIDIIDEETILEMSNTLEEPFLLSPGAYLVFTSNPTIVKAQYNVGTSIRPPLLLLKNFPNFPDAAGICVLKTIDGVTIDSLSYSEKWHYALLHDKNGIALERIDYNKPSNDKNNWHSAAGDVGYGTPTYLNSQFHSSGISEDAISVEPEVFSPDNDGYKDFTFIKYKFKEPGYQIYIRIFDAVGREIKYLVKAETLSSEGEFMWDGADNNNGKAPVGIYTVFAEVFNLQGKTKRFKKNVVVGAKLN